MIIVTLGTQKFQMNRLISEVDRIAPQLQEEVFIQTGHSTTVPKHCQYADFVDNEKFGRMIRQCSLLITHAGVGSIMTGLNAHKPVIVVPRLSAYKEHVDDHQVQIAEAFSAKNCVLYCRKTEDLKSCIEQAGLFSFEPYTVHGGKIEEIILNFMDIFD